MRLREKQVNLLVGSAFLALLPLAWLQYRWIGEVSEADQQRRRREVSAGLERIAAETDRAAGAVHLELVGGRGTEGTTLESRLANYQPGEESIPLARVVRVTEVDGRERSEVWDPDTERMKTAPLPEWWHEGVLQGGPIHAEPPALLGPAFGEEGGGRGYILLELDEKRVREDYLPRLIKRQLGDGYLAENSIRVMKVSDPVGGEISVGVFRQILRGEGRPPGPPRGNRKKKGGPPPGVASNGPGIWRLEVWPGTEGMDDVVGRTRRRNLIVSGVTLLFLALAIAAVSYALRRSQRLARLQLEFTAGVSHELRTPLAVIVSAGDNLAGGYVRDPLKVREYGALVRDEGTRLTGMVDQVLRFSEFEAERLPMEKRAVLVSDVMENVEREMRPVAERQGCEWESSYENATMSADGPALHVAVRNLVENALRHGGGKWISVRGGKQGTEIVFTVEDRGPGIAPADMPHLFDPFYRGVESRARQRKGSGLGLALVDRIARAHGGSVTASNKPDGGARFTVRIPSE